MKPILSVTLLIVYLLLCSNGMHAQTTDSKLDQVEQMKKFIGSWQTEMGKDTIFITVGKTFGKGLEFYWKTETKGSIISEGKSIMGYDKINKRIIESQIWDSSPNIILWSGLFTSSNKYEAILLKDIANPEKANVKWEYEFKFPNLIVCNYGVNKNSIVTTLNRK